MTITDEAVLVVLCESKSTSFIMLLRALRDAGVGDSLSERYRYVNGMFDRGVLKIGGDMRPANIIREEIRLKPTETPCEVHEWPTDGMGKRLVDAMRASPAGINACRECIVRAKLDAEMKITADWQPSPADVG